MLLINLIFEFCVVIVQAGCTPRAWLLSDLATSCLRHSVAKSLSNLALGVQPILIHILWFNGGGGGGGLRLVGYSGILEVGVIGGGGDVPCDVFA